MNVKHAWLPLLLCAVLLSACDYIVLPEEEVTPAAMTAGGWSGLVTGVKQTGAGDLHVDIALRNDTGDWSAMAAAAGKPAVLTAGDGQTFNCATVVAGTGGHRLAPGFQMRGFTGGTRAAPEIVELYVECKGATAPPGSKLSLEYTYVTGEYNYYYQAANQAGGTLQLDLDAVSAGLQYPVAAPIDGLIQPAGAEIKAINDCVLTLAGVTRTDKGLQFTWQTANPGEYPTYVHIGVPPVIGADGIIYGVYESPDIASVPIASPGKTAEWTTDVAVPAEAQGLYILLSVESKKQRLFTNYAIDIAGR